jgi:hypothetical protein
MFKVHGRHRPGQRALTRLCFLGNGSAGRADLTPAAQQAHVEIARAMDERYGRVMRYAGHRDFMAKACPGDELYRYIRCRPREPDGHASSRQVERASAAVSRAPSSMCSSPSSHSPLAGSDVRFLSVGVWFRALR